MLSVDDPDFFTVGHGDLAESVLSFFVVKSTSV